METTPARISSQNFNVNSVPVTPINFSKELKQVLHERNLLTVKTRTKVCSMLDNLSPNETIMTDKRLKFRLQAIEEILTSEKSYLNQLEILMNYFIIPLKERAIIDDASHMTLFGQIEMIYNLNGELLHELEVDLENVGNAFLKIAPFFKLYSVYAFDYKNALLILQDLINKNPVFRKFLENTESRPEIQTKLNALMITPIQRVPRYRLLLEQVLMYTSPSDPDYKILKESIKQVELTVSHINSVIEDQEITQILLNLQNSLVNRTPNIVKPSRKIVKEGILHKVTRNGTQVKRYCVLMSDIFMYCKILKDRTKNTLVENSLQCCCIFPLKKCKIYELFPGNFKITCQGDGVILCTSDINLGRHWVTTLKDTIDLHIQYRKTLRKESSKRTPMRKKDIKNFESNEIQSPNRRKSDYDSVFRCKSISDDEDENYSSSCFSFRSKIKKRKHDDTIEPTTLFKCPRTPLNQTNQRSQLQLLSRKSALKIQTPSVIRQNSTKEVVPNNSTSVNSEESDITYGFANRLSNSKTYYRTHNIDSTIPKLFHDSSSSSSNEIQQNNVKDTLYPLRSNSGSSLKSEEENWLHRRKCINEYEKENFTNLTTQKKRVKFDDDIVPSPTEGLLNSYKPSPLFSSSSSSSSPTSYETMNNKVKPKAFQFSNENVSLSSNTKQSLLQRISNFFSKLF